VAWWHPPSASQPFTYRCLAHRAERRNASITLQFVSAVLSVGLQEPALPEAEPEFRERRGCRGIELRSQAPRSTSHRARPRLN
jgi:hypothetical protein